VIPNAAIRFVETMPRPADGVEYDDDESEQGNEIRRSPPPPPSLLARWPTVAGARTTGATSRPLLEQVFVKAPAQQRPTCLRDDVGGVRGRDCPPASRAWLLKWRGFAAVARAAAIGKPRSSSSTRYA